MKFNNKTFRHLSSTVFFFVVVGLEPAATLRANELENTTQLLAPAIATIESTYGKLPLSFEANHGQWDASVQFVTRGRGHTLFLMPTEAVLALRTHEAKDHKPTEGAIRLTPLPSPSANSQSVVRMTFAGAASQAEMVGLDQLPGIVNYFIGDDPTKWHTNIPTYQKIE